MLIAPDPFISRCHCMINYQEFFENNLSDPYLSFLLGGHHRVGHRSILLNLPQSLFKYILDFLLEPHFPLLISPDHPTFIRLSNTSPYTLYPGIIFNVGTDITMKISELTSETCKIVLCRSAALIITLDAEEGKEYVFGRKEFSEFGVSEGRISRIQFRIFYNKAT